MSGKKPGQSIQHQSLGNAERTIHVKSKRASTPHAMAHARKPGRFSCGRRSGGKGRDRTWRTRLSRLDRRHCKIRISGLGGLPVHGTPCVFDGPINGRCFQAWGEQLPVPTLRPGDIVILDSLDSPQGKAGPTSDPRRRRKAVVPAALFARPQPDRADLRQDQALDARCPETHRRRHLAPSRQPHRHHRTSARTTSVTQDSAQTKTDTL